MTLPLTQGAGPFPFTDVGVDVSAFLFPGLVQASFAGTSISPLGAQPVGGQGFVPGATTVNLNYNSAWTGSATGAAVASFDSNLVAILGPLQASVPLLHVPLQTAVTGNLGPSLQAGGTGNVTNTDLKTATFSFGLEADVGPCPLCEEVASVSVDVSIGAQLQQTLGWNSKVTYGDQVWYNASKTLSATDTTSFVAGVGGTVSNVFTGLPSNLSLTSGETIHMHILPKVRLNLDLNDYPDLSVPASIQLAADAFGFSTSTNYPLGSLYDLSSGTKMFDFTGDWLGPQFYSVPLIFTSGCGVTAGCPGTLNFPAGGSISTGSGGDGFPVDLLPQDLLTPSDWLGTVTGDGTSPVGPLFPNGDLVPPGYVTTDGSNPCATSGPCRITAIAFTPVPEPASIVLLASLVGYATVFRRGNFRGPRRV